MTNWVLVADSRRAKVFATEDAHFVLSEVADFTRPRETLHGDNPAGHVSAGHSGTRHGLAAATPSKDKESRAFAAELVQYLQHEFLQQHFAKLILVAPPEFLGEVRAAMSELLRATVTGSIAKDFLSYSDAELTEHLRGQRGLL